MGRRLEVEIAGRDRLSPALKTAKANVAGFASGLKVATGATAVAATVIGGKAVSAFADFEQQLSNIKAVSQPSEFAHMGEVADLAKQIGIETTFSSKEAVGAFVELRKAGIGVKNILGGVGRAAVDLAAAGELDMASAAQISAAAMNVFNLKAEDSAHVSDLLAGAASASATTVALMGESLTAAGPAATTVGASIDDTAVAIAAMAKRGVVGSQAGNSLKRALLSLAKPSKAAAAMMSSLGIAVFDAAGNLKPMADVAGEIQSGLAGLTKEAQAQALAEIFGNFGLQAGAALQSLGKEGFQQLAKDMSQISAADVAKTKLDNLRGSITLMKGSLETLLVSLGEGFGPVLRAGVDAVTALANALIPLGAVIKSIPQPILALLAVGTPLLAFFSTLQMSTAILPKALTPVAESILGFAAPITTILPLAAALFLAYKTNFLGIRDAIGPVVDFVIDKLKMARVAVSAFIEGFKFGGGIKSPFDALLVGLDNVTAKVPGARGLVDGLKAAVAAVRPAAEIVGTALSNLAGFLSDHREILVGVAAAWTTFKAAMVVGKAVSGVQAGFALIRAALLATKASMLTTQITARGMWAAIGGPLGLLAIAVGVFATAWAGNWGGIREKTATVIAWLQDHLALIAKILVGVTFPLAGLKMAWDANLFGIRDITAKAMGAIVQKLDALAVKLGFPAGAVKRFASAVKGNFKLASTAVSEWIGRMVDKLGIFGDAIRRIAGMLGFELGGAVSSGLSEAAKQAGARANAQRIADDMEQSLVGGRQRVAAGAKSMVSAADDAIKQKSIDAAVAAKASGADIAGEMGAGIAEGAGGGDSGAGQDPVQAAMQAVSTVAQAVQSGLDAAEKMFTFRGAPPEQIVDQVFDFLRDLASRAVELASDIGPEVAQNAGQAWQMLQTVTGALSGMVELGDKLARFRVPTTDNLSALKGLARRIADIALDITDSFLSGDLTSSLEDLAIGQKVAENLTAWTDLLKGMAEATSALARGRFNVDLGPVLGFISGLVDMGLSVVNQLQGRLGDQMRVALMDTKDVADTLAPWSEILGKLGETTKGIAVMRPVSLDGVLSFLGGLTDMTITLRSQILARLGPEMLIALEDSREIADTYAKWTEPLAKLGEAAAGIETVRRLAQQRSDTTMTALRDFLLDLAGVTGSLVRGAQQSLRAQLLVTVDDSKEIASAFGAWLDPLAKLGEAALAIDIVRRLNQRRTDTTMAALMDFLVDLAGVSGALVRGAQSALRDQLLVTAEDSKLVASAFGAWLEPLAKLGEAALSIDVVRRLTQTRADLSLDGVVELLTGIASRTAAMVTAVERDSGAADRLGVSKLVAETFGVWLDVVIQANDASKALRSMKGVGDDAFRRVQELLESIASRTAAMVVAVSRDADPEGLLGLSSTVAQTFGAWLEMISMVSSATDSLRSAKAVPEGVLDDAVALLVGISERTSEMVAKVAAGADPSGAQALSAQFAQTIQAWIETYGAAAELSSKLVNVEAIRPGELQVVQDLIASLVDRVQLMAAEWVSMDDVTRGELVPALQDYTSVAGDAVSLFSDAAGLGKAMASTVAVQDGDLGLVETAIKSVLAKVKALAADFMPEIRTDAERLRTEIADYVSIAGDALSLFMDAAGIGAAMDEATALNAARLGLVETGIQLVVDLVGRMASGWARAQSRVNESKDRIEAFAGAAKAALELMKPAMEAISALGSDDLGAVSSVALGRVERGIAAVLALVEGLASGFLTAEGLLDTTRTEAIEGFSSAVSEAVGAVADVVGLLTDLHSTQGQLGSLTPAVKAQVQRSVRDLVALMVELASGFHFAQVESRKAIAGAAEFGGQVGEIAGSVSDIVSTLTDLGEFVVSDAAKAAGAKGFGDQVRRLLTANIRMMLQTFGQVMDDLGRDALADAAVVGEKVKPIAEGIGAAIEPLTKLLNNPFASASARTRMGRTSSGFGALARGDALVNKVASGIQRMVSALVKGLQGITIPPGLDAPVIALSNLLTGLMDIIERAMGMPEIDFAKLDDLVRAANILGGVTFNPAFEGVGGGGGTGGGPGGGGGPILFSGATVMLNTPILQISSLQMAFEIDGEVIEKVATSESFRQAMARERRQEPGS